MDKLSKKKRSEVMGKIKGKNTKPERILFDALSQAGLKFKKHYKILGNPDIVFPTEKFAIFVDGDFWHGHFFNIRKLTLPEYWVRKIQRNMDRDKIYTQQLRNEGWKVVRLWEQDILKNVDKPIVKILKAIKMRNSLSNVL